MKCLLRRALEEQADQEKPIVITGPLSAAFTAALNTTHSKEDSETGKPGLESQAMEVAEMQKMAAVLAPPESQVSDAVRVYGVSRTDIEEDDIVNITQELANTPNDRRDDFIVVFDTTDEPEGEERIVRLGEALECIMESYGCKMYTSLEAFAKDRFH